MPISEPYDRSAHVTARFDTIDLLRGLAIFAVVLLHISMRFASETALTLRQTVSPRLFHLLFENGANGVTTFFAISGFLITTTSLRRFGSLAAMRPAIFYRIRFARIAPLLLLLLAILSALHLLGAPGYVIQHGTLHGAVLSALTFTLNWYEARYGWLPAAWTILWSLSIEEMFYLFFPVACLLVFRRRRGLWFFLALLTAFVVLGPVARTLWSNGNEIWAQNTYLAGMSPIAMGCLTALLTAYFQDRPPSRQTLLLFEALGVGLAVWIVVWPRWQWLHPIMDRILIADLNDIILPLGICLIMLASVLLGQQTSARGTRLTAPMRWYGQHSYEIYLTHVFLIVSGVDLYRKIAPVHATGPLWLWFVGLTLLTAPIGWVLARFFSEPLNRRLRPHRGPAPSASPPPPAEAPLQPAV